MYFKGANRQDSMETSVVCLHLHEIYQLLFVSSDVTIPRAG